MIKVTIEPPAEPLVTITTTQYGAEFIAYCLRKYATDSTTALTTGYAARRAANAINTLDDFEFNSDRIDKLFR